MVKIKVMLILDSPLPVPAVGGGAVEQLITELINLNEVENLFEFTVVSRYNKDAEAHHYRNTKIYYFDEDRQHYPYVPNIEFLWKIYHLWIHLTQNRICRKFYPKYFFPMDFFVFQCFHIAQKRKPDVVVLEGCNYLPLYNSFNRLVGADRVFVHLHGEPKEDLFIRKYIRNSISVSNYVRDVLTKNSADWGCHEVLLNGINAAKFQNLSNKYNREQIRRNLNIDSDDFVVLFCGRILEVKGIRELLDAFELIQNPHIKLLVIGSPNFSLDTETNFSKHMRERMKHMTNVIYLGYVHNDILPQYSYASDIQIIPSIWQEAAPLGCIEAMTVGLPLIITKSGGMVEYANEECAIQLDIDDNLTPNIVAAVDELYHNGNRREKMSKAEKKQSALFTSQNYYKNFYEICLRSVRKRRRDEQDQRHRSGL